MRNAFHATFRMAPSQKPDGRHAIHTPWRYRHLPRARIFQKSSPQTALRSAYANSPCMAAVVRRGLSASPLTLPALLFLATLLLPLTNRVSAQPNTLLPPSNLKRCRVAILPYPQTISSLPILPNSLRLNGDTTGTSIQRSPPSRSSPHEYATAILSLSLFAPSIFSCTPAILQSDFSNCFLPTAPSPRYYPKQPQLPSQHPYHPSPLEV